MAGIVLFLKHDAECKQCGSFLPAGTKAKWYGRGNVYGINCHASPVHKITDEIEDEPARLGTDDFYAETGIRLDSFND